MSNMEWMGLGAAATAALAAFTRWFELRTRFMPRNGKGNNALAGTPFVRLSAEDSNRLGQVIGLLDRLVALEEQTQGILSKMADQITASRVEQSSVQGEILGRLQPH